MREPANSIATDHRGTSCLLPAYIVGLPSSYRGKPLEKQLSAQNINWTRVDGVLFDDSARSAGLVDRRAAKVLLRRDILSGEIGCALAHRNVYRAIVNHNDPVAIIFEDDARLTADVDYAAIQGQLQTQCPRVLLLSYKPETAVAYRRAYGEDIDPSGLLRAIVPPTTTTAYALNKSAARLLLGDEHPITYVADWPVKSAVEIEYYFPPREYARPDPETISTISNRPDNVDSGRNSAACRSKRRLLALFHVTWFRYSQYYGSYRAYVLHEFVRMPAFASAARRNSIRQSERGAAISRSGKFLNAVGLLWR